MQIDRHCSKGSNPFTEYLGKRQKGYFLCTEHELKGALTSPSENKPRHRKDASANRTASANARHAHRAPSAPETDGSSAEILVSRRRFLYGAIGVGAAAAVVGGSALVASRQSDSTEVEYLEVPEDAVTTQENLVAVEDYTERLNQIGEYDLPYGTLVWANSDEVAACLLPTEFGSPLTQIGVLMLGSGLDETVLEEAVGTDEHFEVYDVRATEHGMVWTEANILAGTWRIYTATLDGVNLGEPVLADEGDATYDTPSLAVCGPYAFWQVLPKLPNDDGLPSHVMRAKMGSGKSERFFESARRMACAPYGTDDALIIAPRLDMATKYYQLTCLDAKTGDVRDTCTLPSGMTPNEIGYGDTGFAFMFDSIYSYGDGIANLGTYTPMKTPAKKGDYSSVPWFSFARTPLMPPAWANGKLIVKSTRPVCSIDLNAGEYAVIDVEDGTETYGEYLASTGVHNTFVTYSNIDHTPVEGDHIHACRVKVWMPY